MHGGWAAGCAAQGVRAHAGAGGVANCEACMLKSVPRWPRRRPPASGCCSVFEVAESDRKDTVQIPFCISGTNGGKPNDAGVCELPAAAARA